MPYRQPQQQQLDPWEYAIGPAPALNSQQDWDDRRKVLTKLGLQDGILGDLNQTGFEMAGRRKQIRSGLMKWLGM